MMQFLYFRNSKLLRMIFKKLRLNADRLGIITSVACAIHCTVLPALISSLPFLGFDILENKAIEWSMISLALLFGTLSLYHGYAHHHKKTLPLVLFLIGFAFLIFNQVIGERLILIFIPFASLFIISAHVLNLYYCRISGKCEAHKLPRKNPVRAL